MAEFNDRRKKLDSTNPTGGLFVGYDPSPRANLPIGGRLTTLDRVTGKKPDDMVSVYRGCPRNQTELNPGDYITTNQQLAADYAGTGHVVSRRVRHGDVVTDPDDWEGEEHIYRPGADRELGGDNGGK